MFKDCSDCRWFLGKKYGKIQGQWLGWPKIDFESIQREEQQHSYIEKEDWMRQKLHVLNRIWVKMCFKPGPGTFLMQCSQEEQQAAEQTCNKHLAAPKARKERDWDVVFVNVRVTGTYAQPGVWKTPDWLNFNIESQLLNSLVEIHPLTSILLSCLSYFKPFFCNQLQIKEVTYIFTKYF